MKLVTVIAIVILVVFLVSFYNYTSTINKIPKCKLSEISNGLKTGDLVITSAWLNQCTNPNLAYYSRLKCFLISIYKTFYYALFDTIWSHAGVIIKIDDKIYIYETTEADIPKFDHLTQTMRGQGSRLILLEDKISDYSGYVSVRPIHISDQVNRNGNALPNFTYDDLKLYPFKVDYNLPALVFKNLGFGKKPDDNNSYERDEKMCSELIFDFYKNQGIMSSKWYSQYILPHELDSDIVQIDKNYTFGDPCIIQL